MRNALMEILQSASNSAADAVAGPVDLIGMSLRALGVPVPEDAVGSSAWMARQGLTKKVPQGATQVAGETLGLLSPVVAAAKAPQIARGLLKVGENAAAPRAAGMKAGQRGALTIGNLVETPAVPQGAVPRYEPPRGAPERVQRLEKNKGAFDRAGAWAADGLTEEGLGWYNMEPLRREFMARLGPEEGTKQFNKYIDLMAATSAGAKTNANARIASYYYVNDAGKNVPIPPIGSGYGHKAQVLHNRNANEILSGGGLDPIAHPKRFTFAENLKGNWEPVTVDKHNVRAWGMASKDPDWLALRMEDAQAGAPKWWNEAKHGRWDAATFSPRKFYYDNKPAWNDLPPTWFEGAPTKTEYAALERLNQRFADELGVLPAAGQAALWLGAGPTTGLGSPPLAMAKTFNQVLADRAKARGLSTVEVLDQFIRKQAPLAVPAGAIGLGGLISMEPSD